ncbi:DUF2523 family protein [Vibrio sp. 1159]|uniref:DUF2523 family protein n=1 Tax=Vibrio TaxID=662 RepID=UPI0025524AFE|nr:MULTISPECIES: DUF2523 family protein [Vibrio]EIS4856431.1 DUF2523 domain-containing protein [Vibrio parahaemolyticus]MDW2323380.1 DUF2523 family protein [Vibrio sp. 1159]HCM2156272.1 DUF2523 domain-containing protein [Vibrio parahaemolyticus]
MIQDLIDNIGRFFERLIATAELLFKDLFYYFLDMGMGLAIRTLNTMAELITFIDFDKYYSQLPTEVYNAAGALGIGTALNMVIMTIIFKIGLRMTPFIKLGK